MKKTGAIIALIFSIISLIVLCSLFAALMSLDSLSGVSIGFMNFTYDDHEKYSMGETDISSDITSMDIEWISGSVTLKVYTGDVIQIRETSEQSISEDNMLRYRETNGRLMIKSRKPTWFFGINKLPDKDLTILIPVSKAENFDLIKIEATSADIDVSALVAKDFDIESVSGKVDAARIKANSFDIESVSGSVRISGEMKQLSCETVSGNFTFSGTLERFDGEAVSGDIRLNMENTPSELKSETVSGDLIIYLPEGAKFGGRKETVGGDFICEFTGKVSKNSFDCGKSSGFDIESVGGSVEIRKNTSEE